MRLLKLHRKKIRIVFLVIFAIVLLLTVRLAYVAVFDSKELELAAKSLHERERDIKAARGNIVSRDNVIFGR